MNVVEAIGGLEAWFEGTGFKSPDAFEALGAFEHRFSWLHKYPRFALFKLLVPSHANAFFVSPTQSFLLRGAAAKNDLAFAEKVLSQELDAPFGLPFHGCGTLAGEPRAIVCLFRAQAFLEAGRLWQKSELTNKAINAASMVHSRFLDVDGGVRFSETNRERPFNVAAEAAAVFAATGFTEDARKCLEFVPSYIGHAYSYKSRQTDVVHRAMTLCSVKRVVNELGLDPSIGVNAFKAFNEEAEPKNLWDYAKLLEARHLFGEPTQELLEEAGKLYSEEKGAFAWGQARVGDAREFYGWPNAMMYYSLCLINGKEVDGND